MNHVLRRLALSGSIVSVLLFSCAGGGGGGGGIGGTGKVRMALTDAPSCGYDSVNVTIEKLRIHEHADANGGDAGWSDIVLDPPKRVDLLTLQNGILEPLGETAVTASHYAQIRMVLAENSKAAPLANSVVPTGQAEVPLDTASGSHSGIKVKLDATVEPDQTVDVVLDFDACLSVVKAGNSGKYKLKPVVTAIPVGPAGQGVVGYVDPTLAMGSTQVSVQTNGVPVKATAPDANGQFTLYPVPAGSYDLVISAQGRVTAVVRGVPVDTTAYTYVNNAATPINPGPLQAGARQVTGKVSPASATVRLVQPLSGGTLVEAAYAPVDAKFGSYLATVPIDAPWLADFSPVALIFHVDYEAQGRYTVEAISNGQRKAQLIDARQPVPPINFSFD